jgi:hypothetical protein
MCVLCYSLSGTEHWTDAHPGSEPAVSVRARRRHLLAAILAAEGLDYDDDPSRLTSIVSDRKGNTMVVRGLGELWAAAEQLGARSVDPLDPALLQRLAALAS